jgi:rubrerythrin
MNDRGQAAVEGEWECDFCGYVKFGISTRRPNPRCPECGESGFTFFEYSDNDEWSDEDEDDGWDG